MGKQDTDISIYLILIISKNFIPSACFKTKIRIVSVSEDFVAKWENVYSIYPFHSILKF